MHCDILERLDDLMIFFQDILTSIQRVDVGRKRSITKWTIFVGLFLFKLVFV